MIDTDRRFGKGRLREGFRDTILGVWGRSDAGRDYGTWSISPGRDESSSTNTKEHRNSQRARNTTQSNRSTTQSNARSSHFGGKRMMK